MKLRDALLTALIAASTAIARAEETTSRAPATPATIEERLNALEQRNAILERKHENDQEAAAAKAATGAGVVAGKDGFAIRSNDGSATLKLSVLIQADYRDYFHDHSSVQIPNQFLLRKIRPTFEGNVNKYVVFSITADFANGGGTTAGPTSALLPDAWVEFQQLPGAKLRIGKFKSPVGLELLESDPVVFFTERALPTQLVPNRDTGVQVSGDFKGGVLAYQAAVVNGVADGSSGETDANDGKEFVGRVFVQPFKPASSEWVNGLGFGVGGSIGDQFGSATTSNLTSGYKTDGQQTFFSYQSGAFANGQRKRISPQGYWYGTHLGLLAEYVASSQEIRRVSTSTNTATITNRSWQVAGSFVLTGERPSFTGLKPRKPFDPKNKTWGAFEVTGRYAIFRVDDQAFNKGFAVLTSSAKLARSWGTGLNWYLNNNVRVSSDYVATSFIGGTTGGNNRPTERVLLSRFQLTY